MSVALRGSLSDFSIADVFQLIGQQRKTGVLELSSEDGHRAELHFDQGGVVSAEPTTARAGDALADMLVRCGRLSSQQVEGLCAESEASARPVPELAVARGWIGRRDLEEIEDLLTRETVFDVLRWQGGAFDFRAQPVAHERPVEALLGAEQMLMDALRMVDEWQSFAERVPSEDRVFRRRDSYESYRAESALGGEDLAGAQRLFELVDGRRTVRQLIDLSMLGTFDAVRALADMARAGTLEAQDDDLLERRRREPAPALPATASLLGAVLAGSASLALLGAVVWLAFQQAQPAAEAGYALPRGALAELRAAYASRALRHALEARRFVEPPEAAAGARASSGTPRVLAAPPAPPYTGPQSHERPLAAPVR